MVEVVLSVDELGFGYAGNSELLQIPRLRLKRGESLLLSGPSGCGKSSLLALIGGVLQPNRGSIAICGQDWRTLPLRRRDRFRAEHIGVIFQLFNLVSYLDAVDNTLLPLRFAPERARRAGATHSERRQSAALLLNALGLPQEQWRHPAHRLSIGQQQRVAAARALIGAPALILADEPTSALDPANRDRFLTLLLSRARDAGSSVLLVSHDPALSGLLDQDVSLAALQEAGP